MPDGKGVGRSGEERESEGRREGAMEDMEREVKRGSEGRRGERGRRVRDMEGLM